MSKKPQKKLPPHDIQAEEAMLGGLTIDPGYLVYTKPIVQVGDFYIQKHNIIYECMCHLDEEGTAPDIVTISNRLDALGKLEWIGGASFLTSLLNVVPTSINTYAYAQIVQKKATRRRLLATAGEIAKLAYDETVEDPVIQAEEKVVAVHRNYTEKDFKDMNQLGEEQLELTEQIKQEGGLVGISTGLADLDRLIGGLQKSDMVVMAGRPGMGKTSLALSIALQATKRLAKKIAVFSQEMADIQLYQRLLSAESGITTQRVRQSDFRDEQWPFFYEGINKLSGLEIFINDQSDLTIAQLRSKARLLHLKEDFDLLIIDYLQLMSGGKEENRQQEISAISRGTKALARELNIPIIALSQLSRKVEGRSDKRPVLSDLRESGALEQDSDVVLFIYRDEIYNSDTEFPNIAEITLAKHRHGPTGIFSVYFKKNLAQFVDLVIRQEPLDDLEPQFNALTYDTSGF